MKNLTLEMKKITKAFPGVVALNEVDFSLRAGEIHAIVGKNGAGKSTLISIISGLYFPDKGDVYFNGQKVKYSQLHLLPVATVYQESTLFPNLTVADNIFSGDEPVKFLSVVNQKEKVKETKKLLKLFKLNISPLAPVIQLSPAEQKVLEILRAVRKKCKILILDEPTATLTLKETSWLFKLLESIKNINISIIYISHRLEEIFNIADKVTVLRNGELQGCKYLNKMDMHKLVTMIVGKEIELGEIKKKLPVKLKLDKKPRIEVKEFTHYYNKFKQITFSVSPGEILGIAGLVGAGKTELAKSIFAAEKVEHGDILLDGNPVQIKNPEEAIKKGIVYITENRKEEGLFLGMTIGENIVSTALSDVSGNFGFIINKNVNKLVQKMIDRFNIITHGGDQITNTLSGGNQQKVLLGMWLHLKPKVLLVDEPTVGIDVETKTEIYKLLRSIAKSGTSIVFISSEIKELLDNTDRIIAIHNGRFMANFIPNETDEKEILECISGIFKKAGN